jgi:CheY-like chemotaxis protein
MLDCPCSVLLVDDSEVQRYAIARRLHELGYSVLEAADGETAIERARQLPQVILLDVNLPDISGFEVCRRLKLDASTRDIPIVFISATCEPVEGHGIGADVGGASFLVQPVETQQLQAVLAGVLAKRGASPVA